MTKNVATTIELDCMGLKCPAPVIRVAKQAAALGPRGGFLAVRADDPAFLPDIEAWARSARAQLIDLDNERGDEVRVVIRVGHGGGEPQPSPSPVATTTPAPASPASLDVDLRGVQCPGPVIALAKLAAQHPAGTQIQVSADDPAFALDLHSWLQSGQAELISLDESGPAVRAHLRLAGKRASARPATAPVSRPPTFNAALAVENHPAAIEATGVANQCTLLVLHNDHEALLAALLVANGAAAQGMQTSLFFTFWGLNLLRGDHPDPTQPRERVSFIQRLMKWMMPKGPTRQRLGQMHFGGLGKGMLSSIMRSQNILGLPELMRSAQELGVGFTACTMSMSVMGITKRDLYPYPNLEYAGVATFVERSRHSTINLTF